MLNLLFLLFILLNCQSLGLPTSKLSKSIPKLLPMTKASLDNYVLLPTLIKP